MADLPFPEGSFDRVLCQMALMFLTDPGAAVREMTRTVAREGVVAVLVPASLDDQPAYRPFVEMAGRHAGPEAMSLLASYFSSGELEQLTRWFEAAGLEITGTRSRIRNARYGSVDEFVTTEAESTPLAERLHPDVYAAIRREAHTVLAPYVRPDDQVDIPLRCHTVAGRKRG